MATAAKKTKKETTTSVEETSKVECTCCGRKLAQKKNYYNSASKLNKNRGCLHICKDCTWVLCRSFVEECEDIEVGIFKICRILDFPFLKTPLTSAINECGSEEGVSIGTSGIKVFKKYIKNINSLAQYSTYTFEDGDTNVMSTDSTPSTAIATVEEEVVIKLTEQDKANEDRVLGKLGYDPFETENIKDKKYLYNRLVDYLDNDEILEDNFLLMSIIEIVRSFNQVDKINEIIATITKDSAQMMDKGGNLKSLIETKNKLLSSINSIAKENGISAANNKGKTSGANTLSGNLKKLMDIGFEEAKVNRFDIETSQSMRQIADVSNSSIISQLKLDESEYAIMVANQRELIMKLQLERDKAEEELRKMKLFIKINDLDVDISKLDEIVDVKFSNTEEYDYSLNEENQRILDEINKRKAIENSDMGN